jgi:hypothetical protein
MKIINNKVYMSKGETPTYDRTVIDKNTGVPFLISSDIDNPIIEFIVRPSIYAREDDFVFRAYLDYSNIKRFESGDVVDYVGSVWDNENPPSNDNKDKLFRRLINGEYDYRYYDENATGTGTEYKWVPYEFRISLMLPYASTSVMEAKTYKYEITLFGGTKKDNPSENEIPINITYKYPILEAEDFVVGGSLSE